ncbi:MAG: non-homologous end-joining DNA ligase [Bacteroidetes bacterium]|nr:non-homologous end-joining DNA ligase [Bacteroidota bacterium]
MPEEELNRGNAPPDDPSPMLATLCNNPFFEEGWIYERKFDGERCLAVVRDGSVRLLSRNSVSLDASYPEIVAALEKQKLPDSVLDGEVVAFSGNVTSFSRLQGRMHISDPGEAKASNIAVHYYLFDLPFFDGVDLSGYPLKRRKAVLKAACDYRHHIRFSAHRVRDGENYYREAAQKGWEGIMAKKADSTYAHSRSPNWLKFKCARGQEFVIGGFTEPEGERPGFGALLIGYHEGGELMYAGKVGTGYDDDFLRTFRKKMDALERKTSPFAHDEVPEEGVHFIRPELVAEVAFTEWTENNRLRHPRFKGLRRDKNPTDVVREDV